MEWVEFTARTVEEAKELALDRLMVDAEDAEFEILEEPKTGLFGRLRGEARVRARVRPTPVRPKVERRERRRRGPESAAGSGGPDTTPADEPAPAEERSAGQAPRRRRGGRSGKPTDSGRKVDDPQVSKEHSVDEAQTPGGEQSAAAAEEVGREAERFVAGLIEAFGLQAATTLTANGTDLEIRVEGEHLGLLVGPRGLTLQAVQDLARVASQRRLHDQETRLRVDIGGYRQRRSESLARFVTQIADDVRSSGVARVLDPMSSADRKVIHDALTVVQGITTRSEGEEPFRRVVIAPSGD